jgi:hypothetical protein
MSFENPAASPYSFSYGVILANAPRTSGVYGLFNGAECIYIGETENVFRALMGHLLETETAVSKKGPTGFVFEVCRAENRKALQALFTSRFRPACTDRPELLIRER